MLAATLPAFLALRGRQSLSILNYHRVLAEPDPMRPDEPDSATFRWQMKLLADYFHPVGLEEAVIRLSQGSLPERAVCVTFDDGYADNAEVAAPILEALNIPATIFVATGFINGGLMWNDTIMEFARIAAAGTYHAGKFELSIPEAAGYDIRRLKAGALIREIKHLPVAERQSLVDQLIACTQPLLPHDLMMNEAQLKELSTRDIQLGAHTVSHPILASLDDNLALKEITRSKSDLEAITGLPTRLFAYPNGKANIDYLQQHCKMVAKAGFLAAVSTQWGVARADSDPYQLPRFTPWDKTPSRFLLRLMLNYHRKSDTDSKGFSL
ncbi:polysaccharide deacetylase family protein [Parahaliea sp. F7430]|uniref:Polysaccharide deacetylase family protein n=1 Tax=Sediminihaliea albiluteola TaxID=2758564 RepID=A0A7W2TVF8_9GAMM|nr:polysaccharide deacetylase family protein [Sediminihaliea albiluteola]